MKDQWDMPPPIRAHSPIKEHTSNTRQHQTRTSGAGSENASKTSDEEWLKAEIAILQSGIAELQRSIDKV